MSLEKINQVCWGILGCGDVTEVKSGPALRITDRSYVAMVMRRNSIKAEDYALRHNVPDWTDSIDILLQNPVLNAIYIATPPSTHAEYAIKAMEAGKNVLVEKPMALSTSECDAMREAVERTGKKLCVAYYRRALPRFEKLKECVFSGAIGTPNFVEIRHLLPSASKPPQNWKLNPSIGGGGYFWDMQTHTLDWLNYVFGAPQSVQSATETSLDLNGTEKLVSFIAKYGTTSAIGLCCYASDRNEERVTVHGTEGSVSMSFFSPSPVVLQRGEKVEEISLPDPAHVHQPFIERVVAHFLDNEENPCSVGEGRHVNFMLNSIFDRQ
ncbi:Gfo/Idh/MocA family protein [Roseibium sediminicola]|uniref:Gfo/Idh/MocA family oxidoreductase n=1 Tax=Roseibium sediminicola TaxID=2933272 RepID=A0ABT0H514_9HYPH|nr:Gfo/Idh/MocA family oxidoreductase [Roseibium sp. CAU 1639]MCK7616165.1 Gfo/Idh/MocA family oxidoreductase [Roseibium sp. CAU 1639]